MAAQTLRLGFRHFSLPTAISEQIWQIGEARWNLKPEDSTYRALSQAILRMSDFYADHPTDETPWNEVWCQQAQLFYFLPLNLIRSLAVINEGQRFGFFDGLGEATDFGAGLGAASLALKHTLPHLRTHEIEKAKEARDLRTRFAELSSIERPQGDLLVASYSLTENQMDRMQGMLTRFENLMIIEPSTREDARRLQSLRKTLIGQGYSMWAPCTHQQDCPLLIHSEKDWCHDRIHFQAPDWFLRLEKELPIRNENLTFSYLLASKRKPPAAEGLARLTGDRLKEKGKSRQLMCRNKEREFLSMLQRDGDLPEMSRGALIEVPASGTSVGSEYRLKETKNLIVKS